jgi:hypothetical protein
MSKQVQIRRGTSVEHESFIGAVGEVTYDTTKKTLVTHDGVTAGGAALAKEAVVGNLNSLSTEEKSSIVGAINEVAGSSGGGTAASTTYDNANSGLESTDVQGAIDEISVIFSAFTEEDEGWEV